MTFSACFSVVNSTCIVLYHMLLHGSSYRSATAVSKGAIIFSVNLSSTKNLFSFMLSLDKCIKAFCRV